MAQVRWAVMGAGGIARRRTIPEGILPAKNAELVAVYSPRSGREVAEEFGVRFAESEERLFEFDWDALYVAISRPKKTVPLKFRFFDTRHKRNCMPRRALHSLAQLAAFFHRIFSLPDIAHIVGSGIGPLKSYAQGSEAKGIFGF